MMLSRRLLLSMVPVLAASPAWAAAVTMQLTSTASGDIDVKWMELFKAAIEAASKGKIAANVYPGSQLGSGPTTVEGVALGTIEVALNASGTYEALEPRFAAFAVPGLFETFGEGNRLFTSPEVRKMLETIGRDKGVELLTAMPATPASIVSKRPIRTLADMNGMKIRVPGSALLIAQLKALGAAPIAMSLGEVLPAFQNGTIDGVLAGPSIFTPLKYYDISKNMTMLPSSFVNMIGIVNSGFVAGLGPMAPLIRQAAIEADKGAAPWGEAELVNAEAIWRKNGGQVFTLPADDAKRYLDVVVPAALKAMSPAARKDYEAMKALAVKA